MVLLVWRHVICKIDSQASSRWSNLEFDLEEAPFGASQYGLSIAIAAFEAGSSCIRPCSWWAPGLFSKRSF